MSQPQPGNMTTTSRLRRMKALALTLLLQLSVAATAQSVEARFAATQPTFSDGESRTLTVFVQNVGAEPVDLAPRVTTAPEIVVALEPQPLTLEPGERLPLFLGVLVPLQTPPGEYPLELTIEGGGDAYRATAMMIVRPRPSLSLQVVRSDPGEAGWEREYQIELTNAGNTVETVHLELEALPFADVKIEPDLVTVSPGDTATVRATVASQMRTTGRQRVNLVALPSDAGDALATARLDYMVLGSTARIRETHRALNFTARVDYRPGTNFSRPGLEPFSVSLRGGGLIDADGNQRVRATIATSGFDSVSFAGAYTSDVLDVAIGQARHRYSELGLRASGYGLSLVGRVPDYGVTMRSYLLGDQALSGVIAAGAQITAAGPAVSGALQFAYDVPSGMGVLSSSASVDALGLIARRAASEAAGGFGDDSYVEGLTDQDQDPEEEVRAELDEATTGLPGTEEPEESPSAAIEETVVEAVASATPPIDRLTVQAEGALDTTGGVAGIARAQLGAGPFTATASLGGDSGGFKGSTTSGLSWGVGGGVSVAEVEDLSVNVNAQYRATDRHNESGANVRHTDSVAVGLGVTGGRAGAALTFATTINSNGGTDTWTRDQRFGVTVRALLDAVRLTSSLTWASGYSSSAPGEATQSLLEVKSGVRVPLSSGSLTAGGELEYDLHASKLVSLRAEAVATLRDVAALHGDVRFGVRYRMSEDYQWVTGLARWSGQVAPNLSAAAGLQGTVSLLESGTGGWVTATLNTNARLPIGHQLGIGGQVNWNLDGGVGGMITASYTVPFAVPIGRIEGLGDLSGVLLDVNGEPVQGVELLVGRGAVVTGERGEFQVLGLPVGEHILFATGGLNGKVSDPDLPVRVTINDGEVTELQLTIHPAASVEGRVTLARPEPTPGVIYGSGDANRDTLMIRGLSLRLVNDVREYQATSSASGRFTFPAVLPGTYTVVVDSDLGALYDVVVATPVVTLEPDTATPLEVIIHPLPRQIQMQDPGRSEEGNETL